MSTEETPGTPPMTRRRLRELRQTGAIPTIPENMSPALSAAEERVELEPLPDDIDLDAVPHTRRQARLIERARTASVSIITPEVVAEPDQHDEGPVLGDAATGDTEPTEDVELVAYTGDDADAEVFGTAEIDGEETTASDDGAALDAEHDGGGGEEEVAETAVEPGEASEDPRAAEHAGDDVEPIPPTLLEERLTLDSTLAGSSSVSNALILTPPADPSLDSPIAATGEILITGTLAFPESFAARGVVPGATERDDVDAQLVDREIPAAASPTPIAASAAVSTLKSADEVIQPPAPEKTGRLMMVLAITAGALGLALAGVLILGFVTGIF